MLEILAPAGSNDALIAAVQNGADAVYLGYGSFNARMNANNFTRDQLSRCVTYCHIRGVKVYLTLNTLVLDKELKQVAAVILDAYRAGVDAVLVQDLGVCTLVHELAPQMAIHASTQLSVHSLEGVQAAADLGMQRVVLARELPRDQIAEICRFSPIEIEVFVHGALCMCYSGQCYMSSIIGRRSGNRGQCAQPCRMSYGFDRNENRYPLSLKDNCLVSYLRELDEMGVACAKIEGRMRRAEYVAIATRVYKSAAQGGAVTQQDMADLRSAFSRQGFTDGFYLGKTGPHMFGTRQEERPDRSLLSRARATYENVELQRVPVRLFANVASGVSAVVSGADEAGNLCRAVGPVPQPAISQPLTVQAMNQRLSKTGGTPFYCVEAQSTVDGGLSLSAATINAMRRDVLNQLMAQRGRLLQRREGAYTRMPQYAGRRAAPKFTVSVTTEAQLTQRLLSFPADVFYLPLSLIITATDRVRAFIATGRVCAVPPRIVWSREWETLMSQLTLCGSLGVRQALVGNVGMIAPLREAGFALRGDFGLNLFNSRSMAYMQVQRFTSATASFELTLPQIRGLSKFLPTEIIAYGRLPMMITENCIIRNRTGSCTCTGASVKLVDRTGSQFPVVRDAGTCRTEILNSRKLFWADKLDDLMNLGLWALRLRFTTESPNQVNTVLSQYTSSRAEFDPGSCTRGLYQRGVE